MSVYVTSSKDEETFWKNVRHNENDPNCDFAVGARDGRVFPYIRALYTIPPGDEITVNFRAVDPAILNRFNCFADNVAKKLAAYEKGKLRQLSHANSELYHGNKKVADENAATEAKLLRSKRTLSMLLSKIDLKAGNSVETDGDLTSRLSVAVRTLLETTSSKNTDAETSKASADSRSSELTMLTGQLDKLNLANERLQSELLTLQNQKAEIRKQIKGKCAKKNQ